jgi:hypothetical protein
MPKSLEDLSTEERSNVMRESEALRKLMNHPDVGLEAKRLYKKVVPDANFPELRQQEQIEAATKPLQDKIATMEREDLERRVAANRTANHKLCADAGYKPEDVEKVMSEEHIANYDTAIRYLKGQRALAPATPASVTPMRMPTEMGDIRKNPNGWAREQAFKAIDEIKAGRIAGV